MKTVFYRVDEKFIHAQLVYGWLPFLEAKRLIGVSRNIAHNPNYIQLNLQALPPGIIGSILTPEEAAKSEFCNYEVDRVVVLFYSLSDVLEYCKAGCKIHNLNLGGIYSVPGRKKYLPYIYLSDKEIEMLKELRSYCANIYCQDTPHSEQLTLDDLLKIGSRKY